MDKITFDPRELAVGSFSKLPGKGFLPLSPEQQSAAAETLAAILKGRPETDRESATYIKDMVEVLSELTPQEHGWVRDIRDGVAARCKFLPTPADVFEVIRERKAKAEQFAAPVTGWRKFTPDDDAAPWNQETDFERKRRVVLEALGYDPDNRGKAAARELTPPSIEEVRNLRLKTPAAPITPQLTALLRSQGWAFAPNRDSEAA